MNKSTLLIKALLILISPVLSLFTLVINRSTQGKRFILTAIIVVYGVTMPLSDAADGYRHRQRVIDEYMDMDWSRFVEDFGKILTFEISSSSSDVFIHVISFISGSIFGAPFLFFFIVSLVYGYFYSGVVIEIFRKFKGENLTNHILFWGIVALFFLNRGVEGIQTVRTWTGLWVLFYAVLKYEHTRNKKYIFLLAFPPLIHFGYFLMALPAYFVMMFGNRVKLLTIVFILSTSINFLDAHAVVNRFKGFSLVNLKITQYERSEEEQTQEAQLERLNKKNKVDRTWYKKLEVAGYFKWVGSLLMFILIGFRIARRFMASTEQRLYSVGLATLTGANIFFFLFAAANRMFIIGMSFVLASLIITFLSNQNFTSFLHKSLLFKVALSCFFILSVPQFIFLTSFLLSQISVFMLVAPFLPMVDNGANMSMLDVIKMIK